MTIRDGEDNLHGHVIGGVLCQLAAKDAEIARLQKRFDRFVRDTGTTCYACETCGRSRTTRGCLYCENERLRKALGEIIEQGSEGFIIDKARAALGEKGKSA